MPQTKTARVNNSPYRGAAGETRRSPRKRKKDMCCGVKGADQTGQGKSAKEIFKGKLVTKEDPGGGEFETVNETVGPRLDQSVHSSFMRSAD